jgi:hypothetical protein
MSTPDPTSLADQVKTLTDQFATLQLAQKKLAGDLNIRFEQLNDRIDKIDATLNKGLSDLSNTSVPHKVSLPLTPNLEKRIGDDSHIDWVGGTTSPQFLIGDIPGAIGDIAGNRAVVASGGMPVRLPDLSRIRMFRYSCDYNVQNEGIDPQLSVGLQRRRAVVNTNPESAAMLEEVVTLEDFNKNTDVSAAPNPGTELVDNDLFEYLIHVTLFCGGKPGVVPEGFVVLKSFQVDCIVG